MPEWLGLGPAFGSLLSPIVSGVRSGRGGCFWGSGRRAQKPGPGGIGSGPRCLCLRRARIARLADHLRSCGSAPHKVVCAACCPPACRCGRTGARWAYIGLLGWVRHRGRKPVYPTFGFPPGRRSRGTGLGPIGPGPGAVAAGPRGLAVSGTYPGHPAPVWGRLCSGIAPGEGPGSSPIPTGWCPGYVPGGHHT